MVPELALEGLDFEVRVVSPFHEMGAYEALWSVVRAYTTFKSPSERFARSLGSVPSDFAPQAETHACAVFVKRRFDEAEVGNSAAGTRRGRVSRETA